MVVLLATSASAAVQITESEIVLNVDYSSFNDDEQTKLTVATVPFTLTNTGSSEVTARVEAVGLPAGYTFTTKDVTIPATSGSNTKTETLTLQVPHDKDGGEETVGTIKVSLNGVQEDTAVLKQVTKDMLIIKELEVRYVNEDGDNKRDSFDEDKTDMRLSKNVLINSEITFDFNIRNLFDNDYDDGDSAIESIELDIEPDDNDLFSDDPEETYDLEDLDADQKNDFSLTFIIDEEAEAGEHTITISLNGEDGQGAKYSLEKELKLEVERKKDDVRVFETKFVPAVITACDGIFSFEVELKNYGTDDQKHAGFSVYNEALEINENVADIELKEFEDDDNNWINTFTFDLDNPEVKDYYLDLRAYVNLDESTDSQMVKLSIKPCGEDGTSETSDSSNEDDSDSEDNSGDDTETSTTNSGSVVVANNDDNPEQDTDSERESSEVVKSIEKSYSEGDFLVAGVVVVIVLLVAMVGLFIAIIVKKS